MEKKASIAWGISQEKSAVDKYLLLGGSIIDTGIFCFLITKVHSNFR